MTYVEYLAMIGAIALAGLFLVLVNRLMTAWSKTQKEAREFSMEHLSPTGPATKATWDCAFYCPRCVKITEDHFCTSCGRRLETATYCKAGGKLLEVRAYVTGETIYTAEEGS